MEKDPVCGMALDQKTAPVTMQYKGKAYYFCSKTCRMIFEREPEQYAEEEKSESA